MPMGVGGTRILGMPGTSGGSGTPNTMTTVMRAVMGAMMMRAVMGAVTVMGTTASENAEMNADTATPQCI